MMKPYLKSQPLDYIDVVINTRYPNFNSKTSSENIKKCYACGQKDLGFRHKQILNDALSDSWDLSKNERDLFDIRESTNCNQCNNSLRSNLHARAICALYGDKNSLKSLVDDKDFRKKSIAEINACGALNQFLDDLPNLHYSEYVPARSSIKHEDITKLSYPDKYFDLVLTSETLEHVPDWRSGFKEINRVLKIGSSHIFTVPALISRKNRERVIIGPKGGVKKILPDAFHGCTRGVKSQDYVVCTEFGADLRKILNEFGFSTKLYFTNLANTHDPNFVFVSKKIKDL